MFSPLTAVAMDPFREILHNAGMAEQHPRLDRGSALTLQAVAFRPGLIQYFRRKVRDSADIEDLVQDVFLRVSGRQSDQPIDNIGGYVFQTAASVLADRHRRRTVRHAQDHVEFEGDRHAGSDFDAAQIVEGRQALRAAVAALQELPERTRTIFVMRRLEEQSYRDIADRIGISVSAVEKHMVRAVQQLTVTRERG